MEYEPPSAKGGDLNSFFSACRTKVSMCRELGLNLRLRCGLPGLTLILRFATNEWQAKSNNVAAPAAQFQLLTFQEALQLAEGTNRDASAKINGNEY